MSLVPKSSHVIRTKGAKPEDVGTPDLDFRLLPRLPDPRRRKSG